MENLETFKAGFVNYAPQDASALLRDDFDSVEFVAIHKESLCYIAPDGLGRFATPIGNADFVGTQSAMMNRVYFGHYVSECVDSWSIMGLVALLREFSEWSRLNWESADEMLFALLHVAPECRTAQTCRDIAFLQWFIETWESI